ncbi:hypothetical protein V2J09_007245 [Rumex salicifolius]
MEMIKASSASSENQQKTQKQMQEEFKKGGERRMTAVESGNKALEYLGLLDSDDNVNPDSCEQQGHRVNLIMTDYSMPGMNGYDLLKRVKGSYWRDVPVIVMSSENVPSRIHMCLEEGAEEFLLKPVRLSDLMKLQGYVRRNDDSLRDECNEKIGGNIIEEEMMERRRLVDTANSSD